MSEHDDRTEAEPPPAARSEPPEVSDSEDDDVGSIRDLLRGAANQAEPPQVNVLRGVQSKIRERSGGKYFADGWSTTRQPPISTFLVTSLVMLAVMVVVYLVLSPLSGDAVKVTPPPPVNVVPPTSP